jgi:hypothetical protein
MMTLLQTSPALGALLVGLVIAAIVAIHRIKPRPQRRSVASTLIWQAALRSAVRRPATWRWWLALMISLAIGTLLALVLTRPELHGFGDTAARTVVVLDNAPTMAVRTRDGQTRWSHAIAKAREVIAAANGPVMVIDGMGRSGPSGFVGRKEAMTALDRLSVATAAPVAAPPLPPVPGAVVHFVGDGVAAYELPPGAVVHSVFEPADNVAVVRLVARALPADPLRVEAFVQVFNASPDEKSVRLTLRGGERFAVTQDLRMQPGERVDATFDVSGFEGGVLAAAALSRGDAYAGDDIAYAIVPRHSAKAVQLVTRGNAPLADALAALPGVRLEVIAPERYRPGTGVDAYVFDGFAPPRPPDAPALLFQPPRAGWLPSSEPVRGLLAIDDWDRVSPLASGVPWNAVSIREGSVWKASDGTARPIVRAGGGAVVLSGRADAPWIAVGFLTRNTDLPLQPGFTVFLGSALAQLTAAAQARSEPLGAVRIPLADAEVRDGQGRRVPSRSAAGVTVFDAERPDIYTASSGSVRVLVAAGLMDVRRADVNASRLAGEPVVRSASTALPLERWALVALACVALLLFDWGAYVRRVTR